MYYWYYCTPVLLGNTINKCMNIGKHSSTIQQNISMYEENDEILLKEAEVGLCVGGIYGTYCCCYWSCYCCCWRTDPATAARSMRKYIYTWIDETMKMIKKMNWTFQQMRGKLSKKVEHQSKIYSPVFFCIDYVLVRVCIRKNTNTIFYFFISYFWVLPLSAEAEKI